MKLPLTHVTPWENFVQIIKDGYLKPKPCKFFKEKLVYLNYSRLAHRPSQKDHNWFENSPVIFYFKPTVINNCHRFFPFDTGAVISGRFKNTYLNKSNFKNDYCFKISKNSMPIKWIRNIYSEINDYLDFKKPVPLNVSERTKCILFDMYSQVGKNNTVLDYRLTSIECQAKTPILIKDAFTIGVPLHMKNELSEICPRLPFGVFYYSDKSVNGYLPKDLTEKSNQIFTLFADINTKKN